jgi:hypothetical protein
LLATRDNHPPTNHGGPKARHLCECISVSEAVCIRNASSGTFRDACGIKIRHCTRKEFWNIYKPSRSVKESRKQSWRNERESKVPSRSRGKLEKYRKSLMKSWPTDFFRDFPARISCSTHALHPTGVVYSCQYGWCGQVVRQDEALVTKHAAVAFEVEESRRSCGVK